MTPFRDEDEDDEWDGDETDSGDGSDGEPTVPCPYCHREILEDTPRCPHCERYVSEEDHAGPRKPIWVIATALVLIGGAVWWAFRAF